MSLLFALTWCIPCLLKVKEVLKGGAFIYEVKDSDGETSICTMMYPESLEHHLHYLLIEIQ